MNSTKTAEATLLLFALPCGPALSFAHAFEHSALAWQAGAACSGCMQRHFAAAPPARAEIRVGASTSVIARYNARRDAARHRPRAPPRPPT